MFFFDKMNNLRDDGSEFVQQLLATLIKLGLEGEIAGKEVDHICYRVESGDEYDVAFHYLSGCADLLIEAMIGGRMISTFKLHNPILSGDCAIRVLPSC